jgi:hypothetical protein
MAVTKLYVGINGIYPLRSGDLWGPGEWHVTATIDGAQVGDPARSTKLESSSGFCWTIAGPRLLT